jgi:hypothetical protein
LIADRLQSGRVVDIGERVVHRGEGDPRLLGLSLRPVVPVDAQLRVVREIGGELQEERPEIAVHAIEVELVDDPGGLHDPRITHPVLVAAFLGAEHRVLLLRPPDEHHPLRGGEVPQTFLHHVVLALTLGEIDPLNALGLREPMHRPDEPVADGGQRRRRRDRQPELPLHITDQPRGVLQPGQIHVQEHPVDALHLKRDVLGEDISHSARYRHDGLRSGIVDFTDRQCPDCASDLR